jgi:hypothetical protein
MELMPIPKKRKLFPVIDVNYPLALLKYQNMDPYLLLARDAPQRQAVFMIEKHAHHWIFQYPFSIISF